MKFFRLYSLLFLMTALALPAIAQMNDTYVISAAANLQGREGTNWKTRFSLFNPHLDYELVVSVTYVPTGGAKGIEELVELPPNAMAYSDDILLDLFDVRNRGGSLLVAAFGEDNPGVPNSVLGRSFLVTSDTYNDQPGGTFGQTIPGVWAGLMDYETDQISSVAQNIRNAGLWRTNIGAVNLGRCSVMMYVNVYDADGDTVASQVPMPLPPLGHIQDVLPATIDIGSVEFFVSDPCVGSNENFAVVFPYVSTIDQRTGDPTFQTPTLLAEANILYAKGQEADPLQVGTKIDSTYARCVRAQAERRGSATLVREGKSWKITK